MKINEVAGWREDERPGGGGGWENSVKLAEERERWIGRSRERQTEQIPLHVEMFFLIFRQGRTRSHFFQSALN